MRSIIVVSAFLCLVLPGCQKKKNQKSDVVSSGGSCICSKENIGYAPANNVSCKGFLIMTLHNDQTTDNPYSYLYTSAYFTSVAALQESGNDLVSVDSVFVNGESMEQVGNTNGPSPYFQTAGTWPTKQEWHVYGKNGIPTFQFTADVQSPTGDFSKLPTSISQSNVKSFKIDGVSNITGGFVSIGSAEHSGPGVDVKIRSGSNEICFPKDQLNMVSAGKATLLIVLDNTETRNIQGKNIAFIKRIQVEKTITLTP